MKRVIASTPASASPWPPTAATSDAQHENAFMVFWNSFHSYLESYCQVEMEKERNRRFSTNMTEGGVKLEDPANDSSVAAFVTFKNITEEAVYSKLILIGVVLNLVAIGLLRADRSMHRSCLALLTIVILTQNAELLLVWFQLTFRNWPWFNLDLLTYLSILISALQTTWPWLLYIISTEAFTKIGDVYEPDLPQKSLLSRICSGWRLFAFILVYHAPYVPHLRVLLFEHVPTKFHPCLLPPASLLFYQWWDYELLYDIIFPIYYYIPYFVISYALPFFFIMNRNTDLIDTLHLLKEERNVPSYLRHKANTAMLISILCNVCIIMASPKCSILLIGLFNYLVPYRNISSYLLMRHFVVIANGFLLLSCMTSLPVILIYDPYVRRFLKSKAPERCKRDARRSQQGVLIIYK